MTYLLTLSHGVYPGLSATLMAEALGVIPPSEAAHPVFAGVARIVASIDLFSLPVRLNLLSAFCGTLCAMLLYHLVSRLILFSACEDAGGGGREEFSEENDNGAELPPEVEVYNRQMVPIALTGGLVASGLFIFMVPVLSAATRLDKGLFDLLLALAAVSLFPLADTPYRWLRFACSVLLFVLGLCDSAVFLLILPFYAFFVIRALFSSDNRAAIMGGVLVASLAGSMLSVYAYAQNTEGVHGATFLSLLSSYVRALKACHYHELFSLFPRSGCLLLLIQIGVPIIVLLFGKAILFTEKRIYTVGGLLLLSGVSVPGLLNLPIAPFFIFQPMSYLPVFESAILAAITAMILAASLVFLKNNENLQEQLEADKDYSRMPPWIPYVLRGIVGLLLPIISVMVLVVPLRSLHGTARRSVFADETARAMLDQMKRRTWLISNGDLDNHLLIQAAMRKQPLSLVTLRSQAQSMENVRLKRLIAESPDFAGQNRQRLQTALSLGAVRFVREWFMADPEAGRHAMVFATPDLWTSCGYVAVPEGLAFGGVRPGQKLGQTNLVEANRVFIRRVVPLLLLEDKGTGYTAVLSEVLRRKIGLASNELGVLLEEQGEVDAAYQSYLRASEIDPDNMSAVVNGYVLASAQKTNTGEIRRLSKMFNELTVGRNDQDLEITRILQNYGTIRQQVFYQQQVKMWSSQESPSVATNKNRNVLSLSAQTGAQALNENASFYVKSGDAGKAEACYRAALEKEPSSPAALTGMSLLTC
jgi:tetratricopeptide (TPR) repeat protein